MTHGWSYHTQKVISQWHNAIGMQKKERVKKYLDLRPRKFLGDSNCKSNESNLCLAKTLCTKITKH